MLDLQKVCGNKSMSFSAHLQEGSFMTLSSLQGQSSMWGRGSWSHVVFPLTIYHCFHIKIHIFIFCFDWLFKYYGICPVFTVISTVLVTKPILHSFAITHSHTISYAGGSDSVSATCSSMTLIIHTLTVQNQEQLWVSVSCSRHFIMLTAGFGIEP